MKTTKIIIPFAFLSLGSVAVMAQEKPMHEELKAKSLKKDQLTVIDRNIPKSHIDLKVEKDLSQSPFKQVPNTNLKKQPLRFDFGDKALPKKD